MCDGTIAGRFIKKLTWIKQLMGGTPIVTDVNMIPFELSLPPENYPLPIKLIYHPFT